jgi:tRNA(fMet)-specific endonuclease VapC
VTHLLDTNVCVSYLRSKGKSRSAFQVQNAPPGAVAVCAPVREELVFGAFRSTNAQKNWAEVEAFLKAFPSLPFDDRSAFICADVRAQLESRGMRIGFNDCLIASIALANRLILVTHNVSEFSRVPHLSIEDWETVP